MFATLLTGLLFGACDEAPTAPTPTAPGDSGAGPAPTTGHTPSGTVTATPLNEAVAGARVEALHAGQTVQSATSDSLGAYRLSGLPAQDYVIRTIRTGYNAPSRDITISADTSLDIVMDRNRVTVHGVVSSETSQCGSSANIEGARVEILDGPDTGKTGTTDRAGQYQIQSVAWGTFRMRASKTPYSATATLTIQPPVPTVGATARQNFELQSLPARFTLAGEVRNRMIETAGGIDGALIEITAGPNDGASTTSAGGYYQFRDLRAGTLDLQASKPGFVTERFPNVPLCGDRWGYDVKLTPIDATLRGIVWGEGGTPLQGALVEIVGGPPAGKSAVTDAAGQYAIVGIYGTFTARASRPGYVSEERSMTTGPYLAGNFVLRRTQ